MACSVSLVDVYKEGDYSNAQSRCQYGKANPASGVLERERA